MKRYRLVLLAVLDIILAVLLGGGGFVLFFTGIAHVLPQPHAAASSISSLSSRVAL